MLKIIKIDLYNNKNQRNLFIYKSNKFNAKLNPILFIVHDAQNFFDKKYATYNQSWKILLALKQLNISNYLIFGLESFKDQNRILEFSPTKLRKEIKKTNKIFANKTFGIEYLKTIQSQIIPFIEKKYSLMKNKKIMIGSSMGGLITTYSAIYQHSYYDGFIAFSNALSVNSPYIYEIIQKSKVMGKYYTYMGGKEESKNLITNQQYLNDYEFMKKYLTKNYNKHNFRLEFNFNGKHNEKAWQKELPKAINWVLKGIKYENK